MEAAAAISEGKTNMANEILTRVVQVSNPVVCSEQRLIEYLSLALKSRVNSFENPSSMNELFSKEHDASTQLLFDVSPCFKLGFMAANLAILETTLDQPSSNKFHVVDFDIRQGEQYLNLLHALSARQNGKPAVVNITVVTDKEGDERLRYVGDVLGQEAKRVGVCLKFTVLVTHKPGDLSRDSLGCEPDEPLAVNFAFKLYRMPDESVSTENPRDELLQCLQVRSVRMVKADVVMAMEMTGGLFLVLTKYY
ncbi:GRAS domain-containing protein [Cephalotus follicularis]|uniref:GRAS domain-containing protein n=1 Tax=Cephalotus follicularis TaxID=3775 RepID=A0A1Q3CV09_CEPFO|nr:GRAS domain-containing protein [Cephalotus follicularis]